jgi:2-iminobutanoate/2-iminopropanoate deaminase
MAGDAVAERKGPGLTSGCLILQYGEAPVQNPREDRVDRQIVATSAAPAAIGPYSQAVGWDRFLFLSGQIPLDPATGQLVTGGVDVQTRRVMENLRAVLAAAGLDLGHVVRTTIFLADLEDFATVNAVYGEYFPTDPPARSTVQVARLPRDARVEIDAIAVRP